MNSLRRFHRPSKVTQHSEEGPIESQICPLRQSPLQPRDNVNHSVMCLQQSFRKWKRSLYSPTQRGDGSIQEYERKADLIGSPESPPLNVEVVLSLWLFLWRVCSRLIWPRFYEERERERAPRASHRSDSGGWKVLFSFLFFLSSSFTCSFCLSRNTRSDKATGDQEYSSRAKRHHRGLERRRKGADQECGGRGPIRWRGAPAMRGDAECID